MQMKVTHRQTDTEMEKPHAIGEILQSWLNKIPVLYFAIQI